MRVEVLDVGQGDSILIRTPEKAILIDAGEGEVSVPKLLEERGVTTLDLVIGTHPHADHIGGMDDVLDSVKVRNYVDNGLAHTTKTYEAVMQRIEDKQIPYRAGTAEMKFNLDDGAVLEVLFPRDKKLTDTRSDLNSNSVVTRLTHGKNCFLFTGDSEEPTEMAVLDGGLTQCDVLKVAHHGSRHSSTDAFLSVVKPKIALISVGVGNRYGHPGDETLARLAAVGAEVYRTDLMGTITVVSDKSTVRVETGKKPQLLVATTTTTAQARPEKRPEVADPARPGHDLTPAAVESMPELACPYPAASQSEVFHEASCGHAERIAPGNLVCYQTREQAIAAGKRPAGCCKP